MRKLRYISILILFFLSFIPAVEAQQEFVDVTDQVNAIVDKGDTIPYFELPQVYVFPPYRFKNRKQEQEYWRMVYDVKKVLPLAKLIRATLIETYHILETIPTDKAKSKHLKAVEKQMVADYKPQMKKLTLRQGKLLIRLVDRYCNQTSYDLLKAYMGSFRAGFWQTFAVLFGASLRTEWDPTGKDAMLERIVLMVESGAL